MPEMNVWLPKYCSEACEEIALQRARRRDESFKNIEKEHRTRNLLSDSRLPKDVAQGRLSLDTLPQLYSEAWHQMSPAAQRLGVGVDRYAEIVTIVRDYVDSPESGGIIFLHGEKGLGKTWILQCAAARSIRQHMRSAVYATTDHIFEAIRSVMGTDKELTESEAVALFTEPKLLVLDDIGRGKQLTRWELGILLRIIDERVRMGRPIIAASNFDIAALAGVLAAGGEAEQHNAKLLCDRLADAKKALHIKMAGGSLRKEK